MQRGFSQEGVAGMIGMNRNSYVSIENGHNRGIQLATLEKIARALDVTVSYLLDFDEYDILKTSGHNYPELSRFLKEIIKEELKNYFGTTGAGMSKVG